MGAMSFEASAGLEVAPDRPAVVRRAAATRRVWGQAEAGYTVDWVYALTPDVCQIVFSMPAGGRYTHLGCHDAFERDIVWHVLRGTLVAVNPVNGDAWRVRPGGSLVFGGEVWLDGMSYGSEPLEVIEFTAPPTPPPGVHPVSTRLPAEPPTPHRAHGRWPKARAEIEETAGVRFLDEQDLCWQLEGQVDPVLVGYVSSTDRLRVARAELLPGRRSSVVARPETTTFYVFEGSVQFEFPQDGSWLVADAGDGVYLPPDVPHRLFNPGTAAARTLFQIVSGERLG